VKGEYPVIFVEYITMDKIVYRLAFYKKGFLKYISSIDMLNFMSRALRRSGLPVAYSQGYNPRPLISLGLPCPVGIESKKEWLDISLSYYIEKEDILNKWNKELPKDLQFFDVMESPKSSLINDTYGINYELEVFVVDEISFLEDIERFKNSNEVYILVRRGEKIKEIDLKRHIYNMKIEKRDNKYNIELKTKKIEDSIIRGEEFLEIFTYKPLLINQIREVILNV
jgi:radical SAM-linked protein